MSLLTITTPFYNSEEYIERYFQGLLTLDYPKSLLRLLFADNESTDNTKKMIWRFLKKHRHEYNAVKFMTVKRIPGLCKDNQIANIMNSLMEASYPTDVVNIDSDVVVGPDDLWKLLCLRRSGADIASGVTVFVKKVHCLGLITKVPTVTAHHWCSETKIFYPICEFKFENGYIVLIIPRKYHHVNIIGSCLLLIKRSVLNVVSFNMDFLKLSSGTKRLICDMKFSYIAEKLGFKIIVDPTLIVNHLSCGSTLTCKYRIEFHEDEIVIKTNVKKPRNRKIQRDILSFKYKKYVSI